MHNYQHPEAFRHMVYSSKYSPAGGSGILKIWNSRDGVTPMTLFHNGLELFHTGEYNEPVQEDYKPKEGEYIWVSHTAQSATDYAENCYKARCTEYDMIKDLTDE